MDMYRVQTQVANLKYVLHDTGLFKLTGWVHTFYLELSQREYASTLSNPPAASLIPSPNTSMKY